MPGAAITTKPVVSTVLDGYRLNSGQGSVAFCAVTLVEGPDDRGDLKRILIDTGHGGRRVALEQALRRRGLTRDSIDVVVCTHAHWDHVENLDMFGRAEVAMHPIERRYARRPHPNDFACPEWIDAIIGRYEDRIRLVEEGTTLLPGVEIVATPGHSAGSIAVTAATADGTAVIAGDTIQNATVARERKSALVFWNNELATRSITRLMSIGDIIYPGHDLPFRPGTGGKAEYLHEMELTLTGIEAGQPGLVLQPDGEKVVQTIMAGIEEQRLSD
jgi:N-acyl homoserine lactone hydrolase